MKKIFYLMFAATIGTAMVACDDDNNDSVVVSGISLDQQTLDLAAGESQQLTATVTPEDADDKTVTWTSDNSAVVEVNDEGMVTAVAAGKAVVTAAAGGQEATCEVTVTDPIKKTITIPDLQNEGFSTQIKLACGEDGKVTAIKKESLTPTGSQGKTVVYITNETGQVTLTYQEGGENYKIEFSLNAEGYVTEAKKLSADGVDAGEGTFTFAYGSNGMLEKISVNDEEEDYSVDMFIAEYGEDKNWASIYDDLEYEDMVECQASEVPNNASIDLNMLVYLYKSYDQIDYAILCGLIPSTPNLLESIGEDYMTFESSVNEAGEVTSVEMNAMGEPYKKFSLDY